MKIAMLGGTYDPIHNGHIMLGRLFAERLGLDRVFIVPTKIPPHKSQSATPAELRLEMCRLAAEASDCFEACDYELTREGKSYSFYTVCELMRRCPGSEVYLITGADMFLTLETWHRFDELKELVTFCTVPRDDVPVTVLEEHAERLSALGCRTCVADAALVPVSSTMIRAKAASGESLSELVPPAVEQFIKEHGLYRPENTDELGAGVGIDG